MLTKYVARHRFLHLALFMVMASLLLAACDSGNNTNTGGNETPTSNAVTVASAILRHTPSGTVQLSWDHTTHVLTVQVALTGLSPKSSHPAHIHAGSCRNNGKVVYPLNPVVADDIGFANTITKINNVTDGIPANGWYVNVHNGPQVTPDIQFMPITCADVTNSTASSAPKASQAVQATLGNTTAPNQAASGGAQLAVNNNQLKVQLVLQGLAPNSTHAAAIHFGSCASQGKVLYVLKPVVANASGAANSTTLLPNVSQIPQSGWYVIVHLTTDITKQTGNDPIACGDITPTR